MSRFIRHKIKMQSFRNPISRTLVATVTLFLTTVASLQSIDAATITVINTDDSGPGSLRQGLADAIDGDTITFAVTGSIVLTSGELLLDKNVTISGPGANNLAVDGNANGRVFHINNGINDGLTVVISGLTIRNGMAPNDSGGGIYNEQSTLTINDCVITGNVAHQGGGIYTYATRAITSPPTSNDSIFFDNLSNVSSRRFQDYFYPDQPDNGALVTVNNSTLAENTAYYSGGAIQNGSFDYVSMATLVLNNSTLSGNSGGFEGGGISNFTGAGGYTTVQINSSTLTSNSAESGGGVSNTIGLFGIAIVEVSNSTVSNNSAQAGGGIYNEGGEDGDTELHIKNSTFSDNSASDVGASIYNNQFYYGTQPVDIVNTILDAGASGENIYNDGYGIIISLGYNLSDDDGGGYLTGPGDQINTEPLLGPLQNNGGPTFTHKLLPGSPAKDAGDPSFTPPPDYDQRGDGFPRVVNGRIDIGALEVQPGPPCPRQPAYWKNHPEAWPVKTLMLGSQTYTQTELLNILAMPSRGDASLVLAYQLIAAKLNIANGANDPAPVPSTIRHADVVLSLYPGKLPYRVRANSANGRRMAHYAATLESYNKDDLTPDCGR
jgi:hypothetical protein